MLKKDYLEAYEAPLVTTQLLEVVTPSVRKQFRRSCCY